MRPASTRWWRRSQRRPGPRRDGLRRSTQTLRGCPEQSAIPEAQIEASGEGESNRLKSEGRQWPEFTVGKPGTGDDHAAVGLRGDGGRLIGLDRPQVVGVGFRPPTARECAIKSRSRVRRIAAKRLGAGGVWLNPSTYPATTILRRAHRHCACSEVAP